MNAMSRKAGLFVCVLTLSVMPASAEETKTAAARGRGVIDTSKSPHAKPRSMPMQDTELTDGFWADRPSMSVN